MSLFRPGQLGGPPLAHRRVNAGGAQSPIDHPTLGEAEQHTKRATAGEPA